MVNMSYTLYIGNKRYSSWSMRPWVLLKALAIPFTEALEPFVPGMRQPHYSAFSPSAKVPCLHSHISSSSSDQDEQKLVVWDSLAIVEHIADTHPSVWPSAPAARAFARSAAAEMHSGFPAIRDECSMNVGLRINLGGPPGEALQRDLDRLGALFRYGLDRFGGPWLAGESFTAADAFYAPIASRCRTYGLVFEDKAVQEYVGRLFSHPAVQEWVQAGIRETSREPDHETDCIRDRTVLEDLSANIGE
ncbi:hypothetical protein S40285_01855 [Stachybotrys chlorohalonatus IBT 40285]|uniref:GST N-terminal domain-containing protein n=1 Tax=Stachybotrys chlorohalonatus (strain IBT 40285) TaxID=1283841 RepID=A0A084QH94_STAC4|nr:hypothetical protein S40285_01855 [Stachybotrys chlorohalonata IBT 40285]